MTLGEFERKRCGLMHGIVTKCSLVLDLSVEEGFMVMKQGHPT